MTFHLKGQTSVCPVCYKRAAALNKECGGVKIIDQIQYKYVVNTPLNNSSVSEEILSNGI